MLPTCLLTGASSFVARALVPRLAQTHRLRLLVRPGQRLAHFASIPHERVEGRLEDEAALAAGLRGVDVVVHLAAIVSFCHEDRQRMFAVNEEGTQRLLQLSLAAGVRRALHVSTISAVGYTDAPRELDERAPYNFGPLRIGYSDSKRAAEERALEACRDGLEVVIVNPPSMYGAGDRRKGDASLLGAVMEGRVRVAPPGGTNVVNVADVCEGMLAALARGRAGERYILGGENLTGLELIQRIAQVVGGRAPQRAAPRALVRAGALALRVKERCLGSRPPVTSQILQRAARYMWYSSEKAARELGWRAGPVDPGIAAAWAQIQSASAGAR
ncbi:MAG: NAD-dependent epimerase/dehydratase family protein [Planctomycetota bacterium]|nr:NAD-dependent epimerase/dehydratase family protein [Planctomycetota bacterium]